MSKADAIPIHSYGDRLENGYGEGHEFSLTITLAGGQEFDLIMDTGSPITYLPALMKYVGIMSINTTTGDCRRISGR